MASPDKRSKMACLMPLIFAETVGCSRSFTISSYEQQGSRAASGTIHDDHRVRTTEQRILQRVSGLVTGYFLVLIFQYGSSAIGATIIAVKVDALFAVPGWVDVPQGCQ